MYKIKTTYDSSIERYKAHLLSGDSHRSMILIIRRLLPL